MYIGKHMDAKGTIDKFVAEATALGELTRWIKSRGYFGMDPKDYEITDMWKRELIEDQMVINQLAEHGIIEKVNLFSIIVKIIM